MSEALTWNEIKSRYPHQYVGLVNLEPSAPNFQTAMVKYTSQNMTKADLEQRAFDGEIDLRYTSLDDDMGKDYVDYPYSAVGI
ncbi:MAG: hypothetical protein IJ849_09370 [Selenomonadaceae bacterium]|nr:hypothetical protein [Selenomonadaceae bacterium]